LWHLSARSERQVCRTICVGLYNARANRSATAAGVGRCESVAPVHAIASAIPSSASTDLRTIAGRRTDRTAQKLIRRPAILRRSLSAGQSGADYRGRVQEVSVTNRVATELATGYEWDIRARDGRRRTRDTTIHRRPDTRQRWVGRPISVRATGGPHAVGPTNWGEVRQTGAGVCHDVPIARTPTVLSRVVRGAIQRATATDPASG
jgi:hypothetical protein